MAYSFTRQQPKRGARAPKKEQEHTELRDKSIKERVDAENARHDLAIDSEFWVCLCFRRQADLDAFANKVGLDPHERFVSGKALREAVGSFRPTTKRKAFPRKVAGAIRVKNPTACVPVTNDLSADSLAEAMAILEAFRTVERFDEYRSASDSHIWICAAFESRADVESFLDEFDVRKYGDKYLDASAWLASMA